MPAPRKEKEEAEIKIDGWIATFGDLISLMLTFFVLIVSMSSLDVSALKQISGIVPESTVSMFDIGPTAAIRALQMQKQRKVSTQEMMLAIRQHASEILQHSVWRHKVDAQVLKNRMILRLPDAVLFDPGKATLRSRDVVILKRMAKLLVASPGNVRVEGHTDRSRLPASSPFHDLWSLSLARAASVLHVLQKEGVDRKRLSLAGYGPSKPISTEATPFGRRKNRRVDIVLYQPRPGAN